MNTKLHATRYSQGHPLNLFVIAGQIIEYIGVWPFVGSLPDGCSGFADVMPIGPEKV